MPETRRSFVVSVQTDQDLAGLAGFADHAFELRDPARGFTWKTLINSASVRCVHGALDVPRRHPGRLNRS
jgi:hypothetical protein